ncbi:MAG TPA: DMT family transporter [Microvirga sp.]|nr:DMT family transporter [Microvirga sp.]
MPPQAPTRAFLISHLLASSVFWSTGFLFIKLSGSLDPFVLAAMRGLIGAAALALWFMAAGRDPRPRDGEWRHWLVLGTFNGWGPNVLVAYALTQIGTAPASMIQAASPLVVAALAHLLFAEERLTPRRLTGVLVGFTGMAVLIGPAALPGRDAGALGALAMAAVALSYAVGNLYARAIREAEPARLALGQQVCSAVPASALALTLAGPAAFAPVTDALVPLLGLGVLATALPILFFMRLIRGAGPTRAAMVGYLMPVWTTILAILFLGETVGAREILGGAIVLAGVAIVSFTGRVGR